MPSLLFSNICKPASLTLQYDEDEDLPSITSIQGIKKQHESFSNVYYASVSAEGLVSPHLAMRSSVNTMEREMPNDFAQIWSNIDLLENPETAANLIANICRPEYKHYTKNIMKKEGLGSHPHFFRYRSLEPFKSDPEYEAFTNCKTVEDVLQNYSTAEMFQGVMQCTYCNIAIILKDATDITDHLMEQHRNLLVDKFSCPACLDVKLFDKQSYNEHFKDKHAPLLNLMPTLIESNLGKRLQFAFCLHMFLHTMSKLNLTATPMEQNSFKVTKYGVTGNAPEEIMIQAVRAARWSFAPDSFKAECENRKMSNMKSKKSKNARTVPYSNPQAAKAAKNAENPPGTSAMHANVQTSAINEKRQEFLQNQNVMNSMQIPAQMQFPNTPTQVPVVPMPLGNQQVGIPASGSTPQPVVPMPTGNPIQTSTPAVTQAQHSNAHPSVNVNQATTSNDQMETMDVDNTSSSKMKNQQSTILSEAQNLAQNQQAIVFPVVESINEILSELERSNPSINNATVTFLPDSFMQGQIFDQQTTNPSQQDNFKDEFSKSDDEEMRTPPPTVLDDTDEEKSPAAATN
jgi:hypothetical protein